MPKFYDTIDRNTIRDKINRICSVTDEVYSLRDKLADINDGLDEYWFLASETAPQFTFDDTGNSAVPIETQSLVAGTNAYKISSFTNEVLTILKVSVLNEDGDERDIEYEPFEDILDFQERYSTDTADRGDPNYWTIIGDYIYLTPCPDYAEAGGLRCYVSRELSKFSYTAFTITIASPGVVTATAHGLSNGDTVILSTNGTLPIGLTADTTVYYVVSKTDDTFQLATVPSGTGINTTVSQTGTHGFFKLNKEPGIPVIHHDFLARYAAFQFMDQDHPKFAKVREQLAMDKASIQEYWESRIRPSKTVIGTVRKHFK